MKRFTFSLLIAVFLIFYGCGDTNSTAADQEVSDDDTAITDTPQNDDDASETSDEDGASSLLLPGPYGSNYGDTSGDFTLPTTKGDWTFSEKRDEDDGYVFIIKNSLNASSRYLWDSDIFAMMQKAPSNMQIFFISGANGDALTADIKALEKRVEEGIEYANDPGTWKRNIHIVTASIGNTESWIDEWYATNKDSFMGIDRLQKIRKGGSFHTSRSSSYDPELSFAAQEVGLYNYEYNLNEKLKNKNNISEITAITATPFEGEDWTKSLYFPMTFNSEGIDNINQLEVVLTQVCDDPKTCEWDRIMHLYLCEKEKENCSTEIARWITSYGRGGKWLTDITPQLPLFKTGETYHFLLSVAGDQYINTLQFRLGNVEEQLTPTDRIPLYRGTEQFNENYNQYWKKLGNVKSEGDDKCTVTGETNGDTHIVCPDGTDVVIAATPAEGETQLLQQDHIPDGLTGNVGDYCLIISAAAENAEIDGDVRKLIPRFDTITVDIPSDVKRVELATIITGHGNGSEAANCAEFCPFETIFTVNGSDVSIPHPYGDDSSGCFDQVEDGTLPNQYGSWPFGRAGWCPGKHVEIERRDITDLVTLGAQNEIHVKALLKGADYRPVVTSDGYRAEIPMTATIVIYK